MICRGRKTSCYYWYFTTFCVRCKKILSTQRNKIIRYRGIIDNSIIHEPSLEQCLRLLL